MQQKQTMEDDDVLAIPQKEAFDYFCMYDLRKRVEFFKVQTDTHTITLSDFQLQKPFVNFKNDKERVGLPRDVLHVHDNKSYELTVLATVNVFDGIKTDQIPNVELFKLPLMLGSKYCSATLDDFGGYFIIKGSEHAIIPQERPVLNRIIKSSPETIEITCKAPENVDDEETAYPMTTRLILKNNQVYFVLGTLFKEPIPIAMILAAIAPEDILDPYEYYKPYVDEAHFDLFAQSLLHHTTVKREALTFLSNRLSGENMTNKKRIEYTIEKLNNRIAINTTKKFEFLLLMINELYSRAVDDKDHLGNKCYAGVNVLLNELIFGLFSHNFRKHMIMHIQKKPDNTHLLTYIEKGFQRYSITPLIMYAFSTGNWGPRRGAITNPMGISQSISRICFNAYIGITRRLCGKSKEKIRVAYARMVHPSQFGFICPAETPDGQSVGLIKNMAVLCELSRHIDVDLSLLQEFFSKKKKTKRLLIVGGDLVGYFVSSEQQKSFIKAFKQYRKVGLIGRSVTYCVHKTYVEIINSEGRLFRPLDTPGTFSEIQFIDAIESYAEDTYIGFSHDLKKPYSHVEVSKDAQFGILASHLPFANHDQACRITYGTGMAKQATSKMLTNTSTRMDTSTIQLNYPMKPLAQTKTFKAHNENDDFLNGQPIMVGIIVQGYAQEDSGIINRYSVDRGMLHTTSYHTYSNIFSLNDINFLKEGKIEADELCVEVGARVFANDLIIRPNFRLPYASLPGRVNTVRVIELDPVKKLVEVQVMVRTPHRPKIGDKFTSRHAQKITCSMLENAENLPWCPGDGMIPDLLLSPHSFPSRLTQGHLVESFASQAACRTGKIQDASSFEERNYDLWKELMQISDLKVEDFENWEEKLGCALELRQLRSGTTGEKITLAVTVEPVYYHVLKHLVDLKGMVRTKGPVNAMTMQPMSGRKNKGGIRFGQMEVDCLIATGCSGLLLDRTSVCADASYIFACPNCGRQQNSPDKFCICKRGQRFKKFKIRHATKLLFQELQAVNIQLRFKYVEQQQQERS